MTLEKVKQLEQVLSESEDFSKIFDFYLTHFAEQQAFVQQSKKFKSSLIKDLITQAAIQVFLKIPVQITNLMMLNHERLGILHGCGWVDAKLFNFFYCKRLNKGMLVIATGKGSEMVRITPNPVEPIELKEDFIESVEGFSKHYQPKFPN